MKDEEKRRKEAEMVEKKGKKMTNERKTLINMNMTES